jgi:hypothetical protein
MSPPLLAFYWDGELPRPHAVPDISRTGMFLKTEDRWTSNSMLRVTLQMQTEDPEKPGETITVQCQVVRTGEDGVGMNIVLVEDGKSHPSPTVGSLATRKQLKKFIEHLTSRVNQSPVPESGRLLFSQAEQSTAADGPDHQATSQDPPENK